MNKKGAGYRLLKFILRFFSVFLLVAFVVTCCITLYVTIMASETGLVLTDENVEKAAKITMLNVLLLTTILTVCDTVRKRLTVDRPTRRIVEAGRKVMQGDFSVRIPTRGVGEADSFQEIEECFNKMTEELSHTETLRTDFVANVSHELKTPLSVLQNYGMLLSQPALDEEKRREYAREITETSRRLAALVTNILKLNKLENQQIAPVREEYNLSEQVCECLLSFEEAWEKKRLNLQTDIEEDVLISSDKEMMSLVWNNLFSNAIKFTDEGGTVSVSLKGEDERVFVTVRDTGCGISAEVGRRIFDKFYQGDTSHATQGNGLGLALVKRVIAITGNDISVESEVGKGSAFTVTMRRESR